MNVRCLNMDLRESIGIPQKFFHKGLRVQLATELFCLETSMVYGILSVLPIKLFSMLDASESNLHYNLYFYVCLFNCTGWWWVTATTATAGRSDGRSSSSCRSAATEHGSPSIVAGPPSHRDRAD